MITYEQARAIGDRLMWDDLIDPHVSIPLTEMAGPAIHEALGQAILKLEGPDGSRGRARIIIVPWLVAHAMLRHERAMFWQAGGEYESAEAYDRARRRTPFRSAHVLDRVWGYIGTYRDEGIDVLATGLTSSTVWVSQEIEPRRLNGDTTVFLSLPEDLRTF